MSSFKLEREIINGGTDCDLVVVHKGGLRCIVRKRDEPTFEKDKYIVVKLLNVHLETIHIDPSHALTKLDKEIMVRLKEEIERLKNGEATYFRNLPETVFVKITLTAQFADDGNAIHSEMLGLTIYPGSGYRNRDALNVPTSKLADSLDHLQRNNPRNAVHYCAYVVDPRRTQRPFYVNVAGRATEVPVVTTEGENAGLYIGISIGEMPPETLFYDFDKLTSDMLEALGVFASKAEAMNNGNTERYLEAEARVKDLSRALGDKNKLLQDTTSKLEKAEEQVAELNLQINHMKHSHVMDLQRLKQDVKAAEEKQARSDHSNKEEIARVKAEMRRKEARDKHALEQAKQRSILSWVTDALKTVGATVGICLAGFRFFWS